MEKKKKQIPKEELFKFYKISNVPNYFTFEQPNPIQEPIYKTKKKKMIKIN